MCQEKYTTIYWDVNSNTGWYYCIKEGWCRDIIWMGFPGIEDDWNDKQACNKKSGCELRQTDLYLLLSYS